MIKTLYALLLVGLLMIPQSAFGVENSSKPREATRQTPASDALPFPPIPHIETIPWLTSASAPPQLKLNMLLHPSFENLKPFDRDMPRAFSSTSRAFDPS
jgi:hypothetical protein